MLHVQQLCCDPASPCLSPDTAELSAVQRMAPRLLRLRLRQRAPFACGSLTAWRQTTRLPSAWWRCWTTSAASAWLTTHSWPSQQQMLQAQMSQSNKKQHQVTHSNSTCAAVCVCIVFVCLCASVQVLGALHIGVGGCIDLACTLLSSTVPALCCPADSLALHLVGRSTALADLALLPCCCSSPRLLNNTSCKSKISLLVPGSCMHHTAVIFCSFAFLHMFLLLPCVLVPCRGW